MTRRMQSRAAIIRNDIHAVPLSDSEWRVTDSRFASDDGRSVLGFIGRSSEIY